MIDIKIENKLKQNLKDVFGFDKFRGEQDKIIHSVVSGQNTFVIMPTGAGKSLCYQLPAITLDGTAVVISPLIALMKNQVDQMVAFGINAQFLNSTLNKSEMTRVKRDVLSGECKLLYIAPESLTKEDNLVFLKQAKLSFVAVDEAHCISEWGHDFRPEYRKIRSIIESIDINLPIIALTATATPKVQMDIKKNLDMDDSTLFKTSFNRANLYYEVRPKMNPKKQLIQFVSQYKGKGGIVYCLSRKKVEEIASLLAVNGVKALPYHAGLDPDVRIKNQDAFLKGDCDVVCATIAFGMGIDKPDVRFVVHYDAPKSLEGYYQETGRAGRDGLDGTCLMFYAYDDVLKLEKFNKDKTVVERENAKALLMEIVSYSTLGVCRRRQLLGYFGEYMDEDCGFCDNCKNKTRSFTVKDEVTLALNTILATEERFPLQHIADLLTANTSKNDYIESHDHHKLKEFGAGLEYFKGDKVDFFKPNGKDDTEKEKFGPTDRWVSVIRQLMVYGIIEKDIENYGVIKLSDAGRAFLKKPYEIEMRDDHDLSKAEGSRDDGIQSSAPTGGGAAADEALLEMLKGLCKKVGNANGIPPYAVFQEPSLLEMATVYPVNIESLTQIQGVGMGKAKKFGKAFIEMISQYVEENDIEITQDFVVKSAVNKSKAKIVIIQQVDRKVSLPEIADSLKISFDELLTEIENICYSGTKLNIDYYLEQEMDEDKQDDLYDYFMTSASDAVDEALAEFEDYDEEVTEDDIRLVRVKFLSEVAN
ncbi:ATP-dependent DNA helicase RecQ [uncultured Arcticibacterium sp.]|uniref:RecQ family ATP-dependent DNA helicase n=1 Tax=uncultured Arcticibacterium sp. TaxID=2173042 RepID=UPI0030FAE32D